MAKPKVPDALCYMETPYISIKAIKQVVRGSSKKAIDQYVVAYKEQRQKRIDAGETVDIRLSDRLLKERVHNMRELVKSIIYSFDHIEEKED